MGVKKFYNVIKEYAPNSISIKRLEDYKNKTIAVDGNLMIYKNIMGIRKAGYDIMSGNKSITHIHSMYNKLKKFKEYKIKVIFVFDGEPPQLKLSTLENRDVVRDIMKKKYTNAKSINDKKKYFYLGADITENEIKESIELIKIFGFNVIYAKSEADTVLAKLSQLNIVDAVVTDDADILIYGGQVLLKKFTTDSKKKFYQIDLNIIKKQIGFNQDQLILLALLLGTDYNTNIKNIGPKKAPILIKKYKTLNELYKNNIVPIDIRDNFTKSYNLFREHYISNSMENISIKIIKNTTINKKALKNFLIKNNYSNKKVDIMIKAL